MRKTDRILYEKGMTVANKYLYNKKKKKLTDSKKLTIYFFVKPKITLEKAYYNGNFKIIFHSYLYNSNLHLQYIQNCSTHSDLLSLN